MKNLVMLMIAIFTMGSFTVPTPTNADDGVARISKSSKYKGGKKDMKKKMPPKFGSDNVDGLDVGDNVGE